MKLLVNSSTLSGTGVVQVAVSFINECKKHKEHEFFVVLSDTVASQIDVTNYPDNFTFYNIQTHPRFLFKGRESRNQLDRIEKEVNPDAVFSVFGPSWWTPTKPHLMGYAYPHYVYSDSPLFSSLSPISLFSVKVKQFIHRYFLLKNGKYYVCETNDVNKRLQTYLGCSPEQVFTVTNTCNNFFNTFKVSDKNLLPEKNLNEFRFLSLCSFAPHKNLEVLNRLVPKLNNKLKEVNVKFILTVDDDLFHSKLTEEARESIINVGRVDISKCPQLYYESDALFLPTLLECSTANYPEAMKMERPILTSNLSFATKVCEDAAYYFDPMDVDDIVDKLVFFINSQELRTELVMNGKKQLNTFFTSEQRANKYLKICELISKK